MNGFIDFNELYIKIVAFEISYKTIIKQILAQKKKNSTKTTKVFDYPTKISCNINFEIELLMLPFDSRNHSEQVW